MLWKAVSRSCVKDGNYSKASRFDSVILKLVARKVCKDTVYRSDIESDKISDCCYVLRR